MVNDFKRFKFGGLALAIASLLSTGCTTDQAKRASEPAAAAAPVQPSSAAAARERPGAAEAELVVVEATVKAIDKKNRVVTLQFPDGQQSKIKCGPEVRNFSQIKVGDTVRAEFLESVELIVTGPGGEPRAGTTAAVQRAAKGSRPGMTAVQAFEVKAEVQSVDYENRKVVLKGPEGKLVTVKAGPEVRRLNEVKAGDMVVARYTEALSIRVSPPEAK